MSQDLHWLMAPGLLTLGIIIALIAKAWSWIPKSLPAFAPLAAWIVFIFTPTETLAQAFEMSWYDSLGISLQLAITPLSEWMTHLVLGIGVCTAFYGIGYFEYRQKILKFLAMLQLFIIAMLGVLWSNNILILFVFWECTSITSFLMVGFYHEGESARAGARRALLVTGAGGLSLLTGLVLLGQVAGTYELPQLLNMDVKEHALYPVFTFLIIIGAFTKSAQFPFHFWLPGAMAAPTPASSYLHSATMVKAGVYLLALLSGVLGGTGLWTFCLVSAGLFTLLFGSVNSLFNIDLKAILANTTFAVLGLLVMLIGVGTPSAMKAMVLFLTGHALYKATLFMSAGIIDHYCGTRHLNLLKGLRQNLPLTSVAAFLAAISMSGLPGTFGFLAKEYKYKSLIAMDNLLGLLLLVSSILASAMMMLSALQVGWRPYSKENSDGPEGHTTTPSKEKQLNHHGDEHDAEHPFIFIPPLVLGVLGIVFGIFPAWISDILLSASAHIGGSDAPIKIWHGWNAALFSSIVTVIFGFTLWSMRHKFKLLDRTPFGLDGFEYGLNKILKFCKKISLKMQYGAIGVSITVCMLTIVTLLVWKFSIHSGLDNLDFSTPLSPIPVTLCICIIAGAIAAARSRSLFQAVLCISLVGFGASMIFMVYGAPDLAITQISVDILLSVLFVGILSKFHNTIPEATLKESWKPLSIAVVTGLALALVTLKSMSLNLSPSMSQQIGEWSKPLAHGANVVNVILVDFRAMDTFAEITVLVVCILGVSALGKPLWEKWNPNGQRYMEKNFLFLESSKQLFLVFGIIGLAAYWRGHQLPGGGFIGGLILALSVVLYQIARGGKPLDLFRGVWGVRMLSIGLGIAFFAALLGSFAKGTFFTGLWLPEWDIPLLGYVHLGTPMLFDLGVLIVVTSFGVKTAQRFMELD